MNIKFWILHQKLALCYISLKLQQIWHQLVLSILGGQYIIRRPLSSFAVYRLNFLLQFSFLQTFSLVESVALEHVLDFELERPTSTKSLDM